MSWIQSLVALDNGNLISGSKDNTIRVWHRSRSTNTTVSFTLMQTLTGHTNLVTSLLLLRNGALASSSRDGDIRIWTSTNQNNDLFTIKQTLTGHTHYVLCMTQLATTRHILASGSLKEIRIWSSWTSQSESRIVLKQVINAHTDSWITALTSLANGELVAGMYKEIRIWTLVNDNEFALKQVLTGHVSNVLSLIRQVYY